MIAWAAPTRRPLWRQPVTVAALTWLAVVGVGVLLAPLLSPWGPLEADTAHSLQPPGAGHPLGTDLLGRDMLARLLWGGRRTLGMGLMALAVTVGLGLPTGLLAGTFGGPVEAVLMRLVDALLAFPSLLLAMLIVARLGRGIGPVAVAVGLATAPTYARMVYSVTRDVRAQPYIDAATAVGCTPWRLIVRHILPNAAPPLITYAATRLGRVLLHGAAFNYLGLGVRPATPEWGMLLATGQQYMRDAPWVSAFPGLALTLTVLAANLVGDGLQESLRRR